MDVINRSVRSPLPFLVIGTRLNGSSPYFTFNFPVITALGPAMLFSHDQQQFRQFKAATILKLNTSFIGCSYIRKIYTLSHQPLYLLPIVTSSVKSTLSYSMSDQHNVIYAYILPAIVTR